MTMFYTKVVHNTETFTPFKAEVFRRVSRALTLKNSTSAHRVYFTNFYGSPKNSDYFLIQYEIIHLLRNMN